MYSNGIYYMNTTKQYEYISTIYGLSRNAPKIGSVSLDILKQFAWEKYLSSYNVFSKLKSTELQMAYKNVNKRIHELLSLNLIQETEVDKKDVNKHNAKYYNLTEYGIYQLFLNKLSDLSIRQLDTIKFEEPPSSNALIFFRNYYNSLLFESFLYPYFKKDTLFAIGDYLLLNLYDYLADCCHRIKENLELYGYGIPVYETIFYWNKIQPHNDSQTDNEKLLLHLKEQFSLESIDSCEIEKNADNNDTITVKTSTAPIILRYNRDKEKVIAMSKAGGQYKEVEYSTANLGSDILVSMHAPDEELLVEIIRDSKKQIQQIIYEFVYDLSSSTSNPEEAKEFGYHCKILSQDKKFLNVVEDIYKNRLKGFEKGYQMLMTNAT
jgi:hypothetical protein